MENIGEIMVHEITLLKIHRRRLGILKQQKATTGVHFNATIEMEISSINDEIVNLEDTLKRRLSKLQMKAATYGLSADPSISIEIEDIQEYFDSVES